MSTVLIMLNSSEALVYPLKPLAARPIVSDSEFEEASSSVPVRRLLSVIMELEESTPSRLGSAPRGSSSSAPSSMRPPSKLGGLKRQST